MVARSQPPLRRSGRRGDQASIPAPVTDVQTPSAITLSHRTKRNRASSITDAEIHLRKRSKTEHSRHPSEYSFSLCRRPNNDLLRHLPLKSDTNPVFSDQKREPYTACTPNEKHISQPIRAVHLVQQDSSQSNDTRTLRSQGGGSRTKSELALYFTNYEQMLRLNPAKPGEDNADDNYPRLTTVDVLAATTHITLIDDLPVSSENDSSPLSPSHVTNSGDSDPFGAQKPLHEAQRIDLPVSIQARSPRRCIKDPLPEDVFNNAHRKAERHEKQLRNIEKERAQHEKVQLDRLLEELKGPDWLKVMGISGVTESEKKLYEPKRLFFIREVAALIEKFRHWKEEEKRRKTEREQALLAEEDEDEQFDSQVEEEDISGFAQKSNSSPLPAAPDTKDVDDAAACQLHQEAISASSLSGTNIQKKKPLLPSLLPAPNHLKQRELGSFFTKRHLRDAAIAGHRRGRNKLAFGEPVADPEEKEFKLPGSILTRDMIRARARLKRRLRRGSPD